MWRPVLIEQSDVVTSENRPVRLMLGSIGATATIMTVVVLAGAGAMPTEAVLPENTGLVSSAGLGLVLGALLLRKRFAAIRSGIATHHAQSALALAGVATALLLSFVFVNRVTDELATTPAETEQAASSASLQPETEPSYTTKSATSRTYARSASSEWQFTCDRFDDHDRARTLNITAPQDI